MCAARRRNRQCARNKCTGGDPMMPIRSRAASAHATRRLLSIAALIVTPLPILAQETAPERGTAAELEEIVVTGTSLARTVLDTPLAATSIDEDRLSKLTANSQA